MNYECHLTLPLDELHRTLGELYAAQSKEAAVEQKKPMWTTSEIERDPVLGKASYFYLTTHDTDLESMLRRMRYAARYILAHRGKVLREKIELIVHDTKTGKELTTLG